jgi:two-component system sensor histidine kinase/response regulator
MSQPPSILVVDDEPTGFTVIQALLKPEGYLLHHVHSGQEALAYVHDQPPDMVLLDVMMPAMDGIECCRQLKANPAWQAIPVIMVTALNSQEDLAQCFEAGADDFIAKPVNRLELRARVKSLLRIKQQHDALIDTMQLREDMSAMIVHDLRNPITSILLGTQFVLLKDNLKPDDKERLQTVHSSCQWLNSMVNELVLMAKLEAGKLTLKRSPIDLQALALAVVTEFEEIAAAKQIHIKTALPPPGREINADKNLLHRLLDNLLSNAIKFSPKDSTIALTIHCHPGNPDSSVCGQTVIQVTDEGPGIEPHLRQTIFEKYQTGQSIKATAQTGLGLTFCKLVADAHGGQIYVKDHPPRGSVFTVEIS